MTKSTHVAALTYFEWGHNHTPALPAVLGKVHSVFRADTVRDSAEPLFYEVPGGYGRAACGETIKVVLATAFQPEDPDACQDCIDITRDQQASGQTTRGRLPGNHPFMGWMSS